MKIDDKSAQAERDGQVEISLNSELLREMDEKAKDSLPLKEEKGEPLYVRSFKEKGMSYGLCLFLALRVFWLIYLVLILCGVAFIPLFLLLVSESFLAYVFLLITSLCWFGWPFLCALAIQKNKRAYANIPLIRFYEDHFEFVGEALGKDGKSYGNVFLSFPYATCKIYKNKKYIVLLYQYDKIKNLVPLCRAELPSGLDEDIFRAKKA